MQSQSTHQQNGVETDKANLKFLWKHEWLRIPKTVLKKENKLEDVYDLISRLTIQLQL